MKFSDIPGQDIIKARLKALADSDRIPHALLLEGPPGSYKLSLARAFAQYIHCRDHDPDSDSCGRCPSCLQHQSFNHIDTIYVYPVIKTDSIKNPVSDDYAELWHDFLRESPSADVDIWTAMLDKKNAHPVIYVYESESLLHKLSLTSRNSRYRVIIVWLPERMNEETANKLLKLIEEPFADTVFVLVSDEPKSILPTIYSRTQRISVKRLPDSVIARELENQRSVDPQESIALAHIADGDINIAIRLTEIHSDNNRNFDRFVQLMRLAYQRKVAELKIWAADLASAGREEEIKFYENAQRLVRENFVYNFNLPEISYLTRDEAGFSANFARFISEGNVEQLSNVFNRALTDIAANANGKIVNFDVALKVCFLLKHQ